MTCFGVAPLRLESGIAASAISVTVIGLRLPVSTFLIACLVVSLVAMYVSFLSAAPVIGPAVTS